jgi:hypothetical protein
MFDQLGETLHVTKLDDWYNVKAKQVSASILGGKSLVDALKEAYPTHSWLPWKFKRVRPGYWDDINHQRQFFDWLYSELGLSGGLDGWYTALTGPVFHHGGGSLLNNKYRGSLINALNAVYPEHKWYPWRFTKVPVGHWHDVANRRALFRAIEDSIGITSNADLSKWYGVSISDMQNYGVMTVLLKYYEGTLHLALQDLHPDHKFLPWLFPSIQRSHWKTREHRVEFFDWVEKELKIESKSDWYKILHKQIIELLDGRRALKEMYPGNESLPKALQDVYPDHPWDPSRFTHQKKKLVQ